MAGFNSGKLGCRGVAYHDDTLKKGYVCSYKEHGKIKRVFFSDSNFGRFGKQMAIDYMKHIELQQYLNKVHIIKK